MSSFDWGPVILLDTLARFSWDRGRPARPGRRPEMDNPPEARNGQPAEGPQVFKRAGRPRSQGALSQDEL